MSADDWHIPSEDWPPTVGNDDAERFKWGWNELQGTSVWKVSEPGDGRPYHEEQLEQAWERKPNPARGDILGLAILTPAAEDDQALVTISAYYGEQVPPAIVHWFKDAYPEARHEIS